MVGKACSVEFNRCFMCIVSSQTREGTERCCVGEGYNIQLFKLPCPAVMEHRELFVALLINPRPPVVFLFYIKVLPKGHHVLVGIRDVYMGPTGIDQPCKG